MPPRLPDSLKASLRALLTHLSLFRSNQTPSELVSLHCYTKLHKVTHNVTTHLRPRCKHTLYSDHILQLSRPRTARRPKPPGPDCYNSCIRRCIVFVTNPRFIHIDYSRINAISQTQSDVDHRSVVIDRSRRGDELGAPIGPLCASRVHVLCNLHPASLYDSSSRGTRFQTP